MPVCCIVQCGAKKDKNQPQLSIHRFPRNESLRRRWLQNIGEENVSPRQKERFLCSLHFEDKCFNKTLDVVRLHDNSVPTIFPALNPKISTKLSETGDLPCTSAAATSMLPFTVPLPNQSVHEKFVQENKMKKLKEKIDEQRLKIKRLNEKIRRKTKKIANLKDIMENLRNRNQINKEQSLLMEELAGR